MTNRHATDTETKLRAYLERAMGDLKATRAALADRERRGLSPARGSRHPGGVLGGTCGWTRSYGQHAE